MRKLSILGMLLIGANISGCASGALGRLVTPNTVLIAQIGFDVAVGAVCGPPPAGTAKALAIKIVAQQMLAVDTGNAVPLAALQAALQAKIASLKIANPADQLAANEVLTIVNQSVPNLIAQPMTVTSTAPSASVAIATVLKQIINATSAYGV